MNGTIWGHKQWESWPKDVKKYHKKLWDTRKKLSLIKVDLNKKSSWGYY